MARGGTGDCGGGGIGGSGGGGIGVFDGGCTKYKALACKRSKVMRRVPWRLTVYTTYYILIESITRMQKEQG
jgi:hypothetical protein